MALCILSHSGNKILTVKWTLFHFYWYWEDLVPSAKLDSAYIPRASSMPKFIHTWSKWIYSIWKTWSRCKKSELHSYGLQCLSNLDIVQVNGFRHLKIFTRLAKGVIFSNERVFLMANIQNQSWKENNEWMSHDWTFFFWVIVGLIHWFSA